MGMARDGVGRSPRQARTGAGAAAMSGEFLAALKRAEVDVKRGLATSECIKRVLADDLHAGEFADRIEAVRAASMSSAHISMAGLKARGWTQGAVKRFLGDPDQETTNPHYRSGPPMRLYRKLRVLEAETTPEWQAWHEKTRASRAKASVAQQARAQASRQALLDRLGQLDITVPRHDRKKLVALACEHYNELWLERGKEYKSATPDADPEFIDRICVNMLRHAFSDYEAQLESLFGKVGRVEGYTLLRERVLTAIAETYPHLARECCRQTREDNPPGPRP